MAVGTAAEGGAPDAAAVDRGVPILVFDGIVVVVVGVGGVVQLDGEDGIKDQDYSLNAGRYVGVVIEDDGMTEAEFADTMRGLHSEFSQLNAEAQKLQEEIEKNIKELFGED